MEVTREGGEGKILKKKLMIILLNLLVLFPASALFCFWLGGPGTTLFAIAFAGR